MYSNWNCNHILPVCQLVRWMDGQLVSWLVVQLVGQSVVRSVGCLVGWSVGWLIFWLVCVLVGWLIGWLVGDVFVLSWLSAATTIEEGTRKEPNINQQSNLLLVLSRSTAEQAQGSMNW